MLSYKEYTFKKRHVVYRGSSSDVLFDKNNSEHKGGHPSKYLGLFCTPNKDTAIHYAGDNGYVFTLNYAMENPFKMSSIDIASIDTKNESLKKKQKLINNGYDGIEVMDMSTPWVSEYVFFYPEKQLKLLSTEKVN